MAERMAEKRAGWRVECWAVTLAELLVAMKVDKRAGQMAAWLADLLGQNLVVLKADLKAVRMAALKVVLKVHRRAGLMVERMAGC
jgi:hypothetical protein